MSSLVKITGFSRRQGKGRCAGRVAGGHGTALPGRTGKPQMGHLARYSRTRTLHTGRAVPRRRWAAAHHQTLHYQKYLSRVPELADRMAFVASSPGWWASSRLRAPSR